MMRIVALNEDSNSASSEDLEPQVTREAEETIAVSEYMRALSLKQKGSVDVALKLLLELLETQVLCEVSPENKNDKLFSVKYNCFRNIGLIYEDKGEKQNALKYLVDAFELDATDVYTMVRLGKLALSLNNLDIASIAFQKCLDVNPNHWSAADGLLEVYCRNASFLNAYGWALHWHKKDSNYQKAIDVLVEIHERFSGCIPFFEDVWMGSFDYKKYADKRSNSGSVFPGPVDIPEVEDKREKPDLSQYKVTEFTWLSVGDLIINLYELLNQDVDNFLNGYTWSDLKTAEECHMNGINGETHSSDVQNEESMKMETECAILSETEDAVEVKNDVMEPPPVPASSDNSSNPAKSDDSSAVDKPKKRRGSDLKHLEQWGWHKSRARKKPTSVAPLEQVDKTCSGYLKRILAKYYSETFDTSESPFVETKIPEKDTSDGKRGRHGDFQTPSTATEDDFQKRTTEEFEKFVGELQTFDLILLLSKWLEYIAKLWTQSIPRPICEQYLKIYKYYLNHYDLNAWNQLEYREFQSVYQMTLFYLEQEHERIAVKKLSKEEFSGEYRRLLLHLMFYSGFYMLEDEDQHCLNLMRLFWINYIVSKYENNLEVAIDFVYKINELFQEDEKRLTVAVDLPNKTLESHIDVTIIRDLMSSLQRTIKLNNVANLYKDHKFRELVVILKDSLINCTEIKNSDNTLMKINTQFEVLLESLWNLNDFEECFRWSEKCLKYAVDFFLTIPENSYRLKEWGESVNFILMYLEALLKHEGGDVLNCLAQYEARLVQSLVNIVTSQVDSPFEKSSTQVHTINFKIPWILLHAFVQREEDRQHAVAKKMKSSSDTSDQEDEEESMPNSVLIFFTAHEYLGKKFWCTKDGGQLMSYALDIVVPLIRSPILEPFRDIVMEYVEQLTYCLFAYPPKRARSRHIEEHESTQSELTWEKAMQLFEIYRPDNLPEFDSYKVDSITTDLEQLFQRILALTPKDINILAAANTIKEFINGDSTTLPEYSLVSAFPMRVASIFYLLADHYFKNRDFTKSIRYYIQDLALNPCRFDAWAGLALSKATKLETKLNSCIPFNTKDFLIQSEETLRCFQQCIKLNETHIAVWIEYGTFAYTLHSYCSRNLKQTSETLSMERFAFVEDRKEQCIKIAYDCFHTVEMLKHVDEMKGNAEESHEEKWLYHYMLGKVSEKRKEQPSVYLDHYMKASKYLYDSNATYPIRISHSNPQNLSVEALEIFYRITAAVIKYLEQHRTVTRETGKLFNKVLKQLANSAFMFNQAKLDNNSLNALKRQKIAVATVESAKRQKTEENPATEVAAEPTNGMEVNPAEEIKVKEATEEEVKDKEAPVEEVKAKESVPQTHVRRSSQESTATSVTTTTTTGTTGTSSSSSSSSSESGSSDTETESESSSDDEQKKNTPLTDDELEAIYKACVKNFEECLARFPEHFKSVHRLVHHYLTAPEKMRSMEKSKQLLLGTYTTTLGNRIQGLFVDRKTNNFFNGIWRNPSSEIDRPGSFASHLSKCVIVLMDVLKANCDYRILFELALQLHRSPEADKKYIKDTERKELFQQAVSFCVQSFRSLLKRHGSDERNDGKLLDLIIEIYTTHRKCFKHMQQKENIFMGVLVDAYKCYIQDKIPKLPDNIHLGDLAVKLCVQEMTNRRTQEKQAALGNPQHTHNQETADGAGREISLGTGMASTKISQTMVTASLTTTTPKSTYIPGLSRPRGRPAGSKNSSATTTTSTINPLLDSQLATFMAMYSNPSLFSSAGFGSSGSESGMNSFLAEYYKMALAPSLGMVPSLPSLPNPLLGLGGMKMNSITPKLPSGTTLQPQMSAKASKSSSTPQIPQVDMKSIIASAASMVASSGKTTSSTINLGGGQLTITPTQQCATKESQKGGEAGKSSSKPSYAQEVINAVANKIKMPSMGSRFSLPSELPKSLTITPSMEPPKRPASMDSQMAKLDVFHKGVLPPNPTSKAKTARKRTTPYSRSAANVPPITSMSQWSQLVSQYKTGMSMPSQAEMMRLQTYRDSYLEFLSNPKASFPGTPPAQSGSKKTQSSRSRDTTQVISAQSLISSSKISQSKVDIPKSSLPNFSLPPLPTSPALSVSAAKSPQIPMTSPMMGSPTKTLQQKLAERQKANASLNEKKEAAKSATSNPRRLHPDDDVIVLD
ncbi:calcineurin-binding protein cabin-1-like [Phlebotomus argentipes]|uniref:calcineurin-binding protein cabin-1-like n=1 Tax=Phlebotomus argentipes TaxID=94469 RepID=UPI002892E53C|nr:calcineurin-binding protein cabin-1-like [Phlebotomus argentipes]